MVTDGCGRLVCLSVVVLGALASACGTDDTSAPSDPWQDTLDDLRDGMADQGIPGIGVAIVVDGAVAHSSGLGVRSTSGGEPVSADTLFRIGSTTKLFVATTAHALADQGRLSLDVPVSAPYVDLDAPLQAAPLEEFLSHQSGVVELGEEAPCQHGSGGLQAWFDAHPSLAEYVAPGTFFNYSNTGYGVAAAAIEAATNETFSDAIAELAFEPAGMASATFEPTLAASREHATGHLFDDNGGVTEVPIDDPGSACAMIEAAGGAFVSAADYARFLVALMGGALLDASSLQSLLEPRTATGWGEGYRYGHGVYTLDYGSTRVVMHGGYWPGWSSFVTFVPERGYALVLLSNGGKPDHLGYLWNESLRLTAQFLGLEGDEPTLTTDPSTWADYVGSYQFDGGNASWRFDVTQQADGALWLHGEGIAGEIADAELSQGYAPYGNIAGDTFSFYFDKWTQIAPVTFWRDATGSVAYLANENFVATRIP